MAERATIARPYARAAFAYAREQGRAAEWSAWLATAREVVATRASQGIVVGQALFEKQPPSQRHFFSGKIGNGWQW